MKRGAGIDKQGIVIHKESKGWLTAKLAVLLITAVATLYYSNTIFLGSSGSFRPKRETPEF